MSHVILVLISDRDEEEEKHNREVVESKDKLTVTALDDLTIFEAVSSQNQKFNCLPFSYLFRTSHAVSI